MRPKSLGHPGSGNSGRFRLGLNLVGAWSFAWLGCVV